ncbi:MAG: hypothetical protein F2817_20745 [Actinobacteria bacterium]|nr:hypothetical protein [Actinomycetota bacterium]
MIDQEENLLLYAKALNARVKVENELWQIAIGAAPLPDKEKCREWAQRLGIPEDMLSKFKELFGDRYG